MDIYMKKFIKKYLCFTVMILPILGNAGTLCGTGTVKALAEGYLGLDQTRISLLETVGSKTSIGILDSKYVSAAKFSTLMETLRSAFLVGTPVAVYTATTDCNRINEVRICSFDVDCK